MSQRFDKDDDARLDYVIDWTEWLGGDIINTSSWETEEGLLIDADTNDGSRTTVWVSGGTIGVIYDVTNHIITDAGREDERTIRIYVREA